MGLFSRSKPPAAAPDDRRGKAREPSVAMQEFGQFLYELGQVTQETQEGLDLMVLGECLTFIGEGKGVPQEQRPLLMEVLRRHLEDSQGIHEQSIMRCARGIMTPMQISALFANTQSGARKRKHWIYGLTGEY